MRKNRDDGEEEKRKGMNRAQYAADRKWWICMVESGKLVAQQKTKFTSGDVVALCRARYPSVSTSEQRAVGPLMRSLAVLGYCVPTANWVRSAQRQNHNRPQMLCGRLTRGQLDWLAQNAVRKRTPRRIMTPAPGTVARHMLANFVLHYSIFHRI
jgi:hypothetical protein